MQPAFDFRLTRARVLLARDAQHAWSPVSPAAPPLLVGVALRCEDASKERGHFVPRRPDHRPPDMTRHRNSPAAKAQARVHKRAKTIMQAMLSMKCLTDIVSLQDLDDSALDDALLGYMEKLRVSSEHRARAEKRIFRQRRRWSEFAARLTDRQFRRYFRMSRECFFLLCRRIEENVGEKAFKSEVFLDNLKYTKNPDLVRMANFMRAHNSPSGTTFKLLMRA